MGLNFGPNNSTRTDASNVQAVSDGGGTSIVLRAGQKSTVVGPGGSLYKIGKGASPNFTFTTNVTDGGIFSKGSELLRAVQDSQAGLVETKLTGGTNLAGKYITIATVALALIVGAVFIFRRK